MKDSVCVQKVKELYNEFNYELYHQYQEHSYKQLMYLNDNEVKNAITWHVP